MTKKKVMVVDDEVTFLKMVKIRLEKEGYDVVAVPDSRQGLITAQTQKPDLIILDIMMPEVDGMELGRLLQENPSTKHIPIIFLTALKKKGEEGAFAGTKHPVLAKPFDGDLFLQEINRILQ